jgi:hypothetical protein
VEKAAISIENVLKGSLEMVDTMEGKLEPATAARNKDMCLAIALGTNKRTVTIVEKMAI